MAKAANKKTLSETEGVFFVKFKYIFRIKIENKNKICNFTDVTVTFS
ncbi:hypothetical protein FSS13T_23560 [Flavobacterium saliperosum S13]|uniref:Uncharacterized protein n=1 Tax=Flavobacterium saliperosum S13 TaxID=1341155 RepID=A0ABN0QE74_9FLAO|nr:hypothetical protein FSS13T_23560 [Flavobacterium saliperosum S13]